MTAPLVLVLAAALLATSTAAQDINHVDGFSPWEQSSSAIWDERVQEHDDDVPIAEELADWLGQNSEVLESNQDLDDLIEVLRSGEADEDLPKVLKSLLHNLKDVVTSEDLEDGSDEAEDFEVNENEENLETDEALDDTQVDEELVQQLTSDLDFGFGCDGDECEGQSVAQDADYLNSDEEYQVLTRKKRSPARRSSSRRSSSRGSSSGGWFRRRTSSSSSSSRSSGSRYGTSTSSSGSRYGTTSSSGSRYGSSSTSSGSTSSSSSSGSTGSSSGSSSPSNPPIGWNTGGSRVSTAAGATTGITGGSGTKPATGTQPAAGYPTNTQPVGGYPTGTQPAAGYPTNTQPVGGYPTGTRPAGGYPTNTQPVGGYPTGTQPAGGYPTNTQPVGGYPTGTRPAGGYPTNTQPVPGYPTGTRPAGTYPTGTQPVAGYPTGTGPGGGYPTGTQPVPGYPTGTRPFGSYPTANQPFGTYPSVNRPHGSYPLGNQPSGGYPTGSHVGYPTSSHGGYPTFTQPRASYPSAYQPYRSATRPGGFPAMGMVGAGGFGGYPVGGYPMPKKKKSKKEKVKKVIGTAVTGLLLHKAKKKNKFLSPSHLPAYGYGHGGFGSKLAAGGLGGMAVGKIGKKLLGAYVKIQIAKYALKFGAAAAKAYFQYKLGLELDEYMIGKFVHRYHQHRVRGDSRWRYYHHHNRRNGNDLLDNDENGHDNITLGEFCRRPCVKDDHRICQFNFDVHLYQTMSRACYDCPRNSSDCERPECVTADGVRRMVVAVNKAIPGPAIQVCVGDKVLVDVMNNLPSTALTLHWHGLTMGASRAMPAARHTPYMDGVPGVTQCPIAPGSGFRYAFFASDPGTHFWHGQTGLERGDGLFGPLIVHQTLEADPNQALAEHLLTINDWYHKSTQAQYANKYSDAGEAKPDALLINGRGPQQHEDNAATPRVPYTRILVENGTRYRLQIINAAFTNCPVTVTVDSHDLILLAADGAPVSPANASAILLHPGERYDAMFSAEQDPDAAGGIYWVRVTGGGMCAGLHQYAALQYLPSNYTLFQSPPDIPASPTPANNPEPGATEFSGTCGSPGQRCVTALQSIPLPDKIKTPRANFTFYLAFSSLPIHNQNFYSLVYYDLYQESKEKQVRTPQINHLTFRAPPKPLLTNRRALKSENCSAEGVRRGQCNADFCECVHTLSIPIGAAVDFVLIGEGPANGTSYPVHLHGYKFWVLSRVDASQVPNTSIPTPVVLPDGATVSETEEGSVSQNNTWVNPFLSRDKVMQLDRESKLVRDLEDPVMKDSVAIPPGGYTIVRIAADNAGVWLLESQVAADAQAGAALVLQVGTEGDVPRNPPPDFPTC